MNEQYVKEIKDLIISQYREELATKIKEGNLNIDEVLEVLGCDICR